MSALEHHILTLLRASHINFLREKTFSDLKHNLYRYDFFLPTFNILIEVNGRQHYEYTKFFHKKRSDFTKAQERDRRKISYALSHKIPLYCIPFWEVENLHDARDLFNPRFLARSKFHNDEVWRTHKSSKP